MPRRRRPPRPGALTDLAPLRILKQIILLQLAYYATAGILIVFSALAAGKLITLGLFLDWHRLRGDITEGWMLGLLWMLTSLITVVYILLLIARSKLVADFAITIHLIHLFITALYTHTVPTFLFWWCIQIGSTALMVFLGMWTCQWRELRPINFGKIIEGGKAATSAEDVGEASLQPMGMEPSGSGNKNKNKGMGEYELATVKDGRRS